LSEVYVKVSTDEQRDNGYSIDTQLRMIKENCEKNNYDIIDVYNDAGHSGKEKIFLTITLIYVILNMSRKLAYNKKEDTFDCVNQM